MEDESSPEDYLESDEELSYEDDKVYLRDLGYISESYSE